MPRYSAAEFRQKDCDPQGQWCLLYGPEHELKLRLRDAMITRLVAPEDREYAVETITVVRSAKAALITGSAQTVSMLSPARVLVVDLIENLSPSEQRDLARNLRATPGTLVILIASSHRRRPGDRGDRGGRLSKELIAAVLEAGSVVECRAPTRDEAVAWVTAEARAQGSGIKPAAAALLVERVGLDLGRLSREIEKLALSSGTPGQITRQDIEEATPRTPQDNIFALGDAIGGGDADQAMAVLRDLLHYQGVEPMTALMFIARQLRLVWQAKIMLDAGWRGGAEAPEKAQALLPQGSEILEYLDGRRWLVNRLLGQARRFDWPQLAYAVRRVLAAELSLKGLGEAAADPRAALDMLVLDLCWRGAYDSADDAQR